MSADVHVWMAGISPPPLVTFHLECNSPRAALSRRGMPHDLENVILPASAATHEYESVSPSYYRQHRRKHTISLIPATVSCQGGAWGGFACLKSDDGVSETRSLGTPGSFAAAAAAAGQPAQTSPRGYQHSSSLCVCVWLEKSFGMQSAACGSPCLGVATDTWRRSGESTGLIWPQGWTCHARSMHEVLRKCID